MIRLIVVLILAALVLRSIVRLLRGIAEGLQGPSAPAPPKAMPLVRDPVCGTYVVPSRALTSGSGNDLRFFCSERCRQAWVKR